MRIDVLALLFLSTPLYGFSVGRVRNQQRNLATRSLDQQSLRCALTLFSSPSVVDCESRTDEIPRNDTGTLWSYVYTFKKTRHLLKEEKQGGRYVSKDVKNVVLRPVRSLYFFLKDKKFMETSEMGEVARLGVQEPLLRALTQALRIASIVNDYKLIIQLVYVVTEYATSVDQVNHGIADPRILGEAVTALGRTDANSNKIRSLWRNNARSSCWSREIGPREVNAMLQVLRERGKMRALLEMYHEMASSGDSLDPYSLSIIFLALKNSLSGSDNQAQSNSNITTTPLHHGFLQELTDESCWQWGEAIRALDVSVPLLNSAVAFTLLQLNTAVSLACSSHDRSHAALHIYHVLTKHATAKVDELTCVLVLQSLGSQHEVALNILKEYRETPSTGMVAAACAVCLRAAQYETAMELLRSQIPRNSKEPRLYHTIMQSLVVFRSGNNRRISNRDRRDANLRLKAALQVMSWSSLNYDTDDLLTAARIFLCVLATVQRQLKPSDWHNSRALVNESTENPLLRHYHDFSPSYSPPESLVRSVLKELEDRSAEPCSMILQNALGAVGPASVVGLLQDNIIEKNPDTYKRALRIISLQEGMAYQAFGVVEMMKHQRQPLDSECLLFLVNAIGCTKELAPHLSNLLLQKRTIISNYDFTGLFQPAHLTERHYSSAVCSSLKVSNFPGARKLLQRMYEDSTASSESLHAIAFAYATIALTKSTTENRPRMERAESSKSRALSAYRILQTLSNTSIALLMVVGRACCYSGLGTETREVLDKLHTKFLQLREGLRIKAEYQRREEERSLASFHKDILRYYARKGDLAEALKVCSSIENLSNSLKALECGTTIIDVGPAELKSLIAAAARAGEWKVCIQTLKRLRPYVEATHRDGSKEVSGLDRNYRRLEPAIIDTTRCLSGTRQYAWVLRIVNDWISWSGRRPPAPAVQHALRLLCNRGRGAEACGIVLQCAAMNSSASKSDDSTYLSSVFSSAVTSLYKSGQYDYADDMFLAGVSHGAIPFDHTREDNASCRTVTLDLHGFNLALAHSAVRVALQKEAISGSSSPDHPTRFRVVTGRGLHSALRLRPVLRPSVQEMLVEEFFPPLGTSTVPWNTGALELNPSDAAGWIEYQQREKGTRMMIVASMLKNIALPLQLALSRAVEMRSSEPGKDQPGSKT